MTKEQQTQKDSLNNRNTTFIQATGSAIAAAFGVQSSKNRQRDFSGGRISHFIAAGIIVTGMFVAGVYLAVQIALN